MTPTSKSNIKKILDFNNLGSLKEINKEAVVYLPIGDISGYINIAQFTKEALHLYITMTNRNPVYKGIKDLSYEEAQKKFIEIAETENKFVDLDANDAGEFVNWIFWNDNCCAFIRSIKLRHENQVYRIGASVEFDGFYMPQERLGKIVDQAKLDARIRNIAYYILQKSDKYKRFMPIVLQIRNLFSSIYGYRAEQIKILEREKELENEISDRQDYIKEYIKILKALNESAGENAFPIQEIIPISLEESKITCGDGEQQFDSKVLTENAINDMRERNRMWYANKKRGR